MKIYPIELVISSGTFYFSVKLLIQSEFFIFQLEVNNLKVKKVYRVSNSKWNLIFYKVDKVTQKKNFCKTFRVRNSKCDVILHNSIS